MKYLVPNSHDLKTNQTRMKWQSGTRMENLEHKLAENYYLETRRNPNVLETRMKLRKPYSHEIKTFETRMKN